MNFKPALCPSCGGKMQIPDDINTVKCMYCGVDVIVREAIRLAGRVKEFTQATAIEKVYERKPFDVQAAKQHIHSMIFILGGLGIICSLCAGMQDTAFGVVIAITFLVFIPIIFAILNKNLEKTRKADEAMSKRPAGATLIGYEGQCPYCDTSITLGANILGDNCPACQKRIVIRNSKFYSVDTPVGGLEKNI